MTRRGSKTGRLGKTIIGAFDGAVLAYVLALAITAVVVVGTSIATGYYDDLLSDGGSGLITEGHGLLLELIIVGVFVTRLIAISGRRQEIKRYQEEIDDFKSWKVDERQLEDQAFYRIRGNIRRLSRTGEKIDLTNLCLGGDRDLRGLDLSGADLSRADLSGAKLEGATLVGITAIDTDFHTATLDGTILIGADLSGANLKFSQLAEVKSLYKATIDNDLERQLKERHPGLFDSPDPRPTS